MEKVFGKPNFFLFFGKFKYYIEKLFIPNRNFIGKIMFIQGFSQKKKVLLLGQSYNFVLGFFIYLHITKKNFYISGLRFYSYIKSFELKLIK